MGFDILIALPEIVLLVGTCALMLVDLRVKDEGRRASFFVAQCVLLATVAVVVFVWLGTAGQTVYAFNKLYVSDVMANVLKLAACGAV